MKTIFILNNIIICSFLQTGFWGVFWSLVTFLSQIQSITDESRGSIRRKSYSSPQSIGQDAEALLTNDCREEEVAGYVTGQIDFPIATLEVPLLQTELQINNLITHCFGKVLHKFKFYYFSKFIILPYILFSRLCFCNMDYVLFFSCLLPI